MATINDKFTKAADGTGTYPAVASVTQPREAQGDTLTCDDLSGWPTDTAVHFTTFRVLADGKIDTSTQTDYKGIVVGNTITQVTRIAGAEDSGHLVGDKVETNPTVGWVADLVEGLLRSHNQDGTLKNDIIQTRNIQNGAITGEKFADSAVKPSNIDWTTSAELPPVEFSGNRSSNNASYQDMSGTYTIPEDGLYELSTNIYSASAGGTSFTMAIKAFLGNEEMFERTGIISTPNYAGNNFASLDTTISFWAKRNDVIKLQSLVDESKWGGRINHNSRIKRLV